MSIRSQEKVDRTGFAEEEIAKARTALEVSGNLDDPAVVEALLQCEKKCRLSNDAIATKNVCVAILKLCREKQAWSHLIANSQLLAKRRSQSKVAITGIVAQGLEQLEDTAIKLDDATREELLKTLCDVTDGKMYCAARESSFKRPSIWDISWRGRGESLFTRPSVSEGRRVQVWAENMAAVPR